ncbi:recombination-associated protein RdgC [Thiocystis violascens]|uniref:Recombination-associated protein RdgC n=1 Tax=Thiocystis violascens (strain ATCC 17096 / DSM 198 / 6111) TaxID=765911 RepID=I3YBT2_THIV6|nr:recombination-associated protein RdgC [Thiocystis violascens]AFL74450.1 DNA recombination-dependent growth factor C [Thiocystis violascens DSM 198]
MFKNARFFRLDTPFALDAAELEARLGERRFRPCGPIETATLGWSSPLGEETAGLVHGVGGCLLMCARKQERLLPSAAVAEAVDERVSELESGEARDVGRAERRRLREQIVTEMLPRAFTRSRRTQLYIDTEAGWMVVDAASEKQAEEVVSLLRETLETLPAKLPDPNKTPSTVMTSWLLDGTAPPDFVAGDACELRDSDDSAGVVRCSGQDLASDEMLNHIRAGKRVTKLALEWDERLSFVLAEDLSLKRLRVGDALLEEMDDTDLEPAARLDAEFAILALQMRQLIERLDEVFGLLSTD